MKILSSVGVVLAVCGITMSPAVAELSCNPSMQPQKLGAGPIDKDGSPLVESAQETDPVLSPQSASELETLASSSGKPSSSLQPRYLVTYMGSDGGSATRSATVVTVTNQSTTQACQVQVKWYRGYEPVTPVCTSTATLNPGFTADYCSRCMPVGVTDCNVVCDPELTADEGKAIVSTTCPKLGVDSRVYYTMEGNLQVSGVSNPKIIHVSGGNAGD
jgi:hypothetical protein